MKFLEGHSKAVWVKGRVTVTSASHGLDYMAVFLENAAVGKEF